MASNKENGTQVYGLIILDRETDVNEVKVPDGFEMFFNVQTITNKLRELMKEGKTLKLVRIDRIISGTGTVNSIFFIRKYSDRFAAQMDGSIFWKYKNKKQYVYGHGKAIEYPRFMAHRFTYD